MKAAVIHSFDGIEKITLEEIPTPNCKENEVQIQILYAGVNPVDWKIAEGLLQSRMSYEFPIILGWDASGVISAVGKKVKNFKKGDPVFAYCRKEALRDGSYAEYICLEEKHVAIKPKNLSYKEAACVPLSALTAWQSLYDTAKIKKGNIVLIHAGAGGVGTFAIQLAKLQGAHVITTTSVANREYVKEFGADEIIDYTKENFAEVILKKYPSGIDFVYDTVGDKTLKLSYDVVKKGGCLISIAGVIDQGVAKERGFKAEFVFVHPDSAELKKIATLIEDSKIKLPRIQEIPLKDVISALRQNRERHSQGKLVLKIS